MKIVNDGTLGFHIAKYVQKIANEKSMDSFSCWFVEYFIIPYKKESKVIEWLTETIGFKKVPTIDKIYYRLKEIELIENATT